MKNTLLVIILFFALVILTAISDYAYSESVYQSRIDEQILYASLNADRHTIYNGYTIEEYGESYEKPEKFLGRVIMNVPVINQHPELPCGCEMVSAVALLNYLGYDIDKMEFTEKYITYKDDFYTDDNDVLHGPDPFRFFVGNPYNWGLGCYAPVIENSINTYFEDIHSPDKAVAIDNLNIADLEKLLDEGVPVIVWASQEMMPYKYRDSTKWMIDETDREHTWLANSHTLVLVGYDTDCYYFMDCNDKEEIVPYSKEGFVKRWTEQGCQTIAIKRADKKK